MNLYAAIIRLSDKQERAVVIKAPTITAAYKKADSMRGMVLNLAPLVSNEVYLRAIENAK